jgi:hypothetical protein
MSVACFAFHAVVHALHVRLKDFTKSFNADLLFAGIERQSFRMVGRCYTAVLCCYRYDG